MAKVAIVTGASRGLGKGCASVLASEAGYTVYATGRTTGDLEKLAANARLPARARSFRAARPEGRRRGAGVRVEGEGGGRRSTSSSTARTQGLEAQKPCFAKRFYERPIAEFDAHMNVGVRSSYVMASLVAPIMVEAKQGLIVQISSTGGAQYLFNTPYGVAHAAMLDRLTADMAAELTELGVQCVTLWPLSCVTEKAAFPDGESPTFVGRCLAALARRPTTTSRRPTARSSTRRKLPPSTGWSIRRARSPSACSPAPTFRRPCARTRGACRSPTTAPTPT